MAAEAFEGAGEVLRDLRAAARWSQQELADHAGRGASRRMISMVESGAQRASTSFISAVAKALEVDPVVFVSTAHQSGPSLGRVESALPEIRRVLATYDCPSDLGGPQRELDRIAADVERACALRLAARYGELAGMLVPILDELTVCAHMLDGCDRERAFWLLAMAYRCVDAVLYKSGHPDISSIATDRMSWAASRSGDPLMVATVGYVRAQAFFDLGASTVERGLGLLARTAAPLESSLGTDQQAAGVYVALQVRSGILAAKAGQSATALEHLDAAEQAVGQIGANATVYGTYVGSNSLAISRFTAFVELGDGESAIEAARGWRPAPDIPQERSSHALIDLARALTWVDQQPQALEYLLTARSLAPQHTRMHPMVAPTLERVRTRLSRRSDRAEALAAWLGLPSR